MEAENWLNNRCILMEKLHFLVESLLLLLAVVEVANVKPFNKRSRPQLVKYTHYKLFIMKTTSPLSLHVTVSDLTDHQTITVSDLTDHHFKLTHFPGRF